MAKLDRFLQKIFGSSGGTSEFGKIGSLAAGAPEYSKNIDTIQALSQYARGLYGITASASEPPRIQDINALYFLITTQLKYLFQAGIPEWISTEDYYIGSFCQVDGIIYVSLSGTDGTPNTGNNPETDAVNWRDLDAYYRNAANLTGTISLDRIPAELTGKNASTADSADNADNADNADAVTVEAISTNASFPIALLESSGSGSKAVKSDTSGGTYNPSTNKATINISGNADGSSSSCTGNAASSNVSDSINAIEPGGTIGSASYIRINTSTNAVDYITVGPFTTVPSGYRYIKIV